MDSSMNTIEQWLLSLSNIESLQVFQLLSEYLSVRELKGVMADVRRGKDLYTIHRNMGLLKKYQVDLIRIQELLRGDI